MLCINKNGQKNGQATVVFQDEEQVAMAMMRHEHHLKNHGRYLQVHSHVAHNVTCHVTCHVTYLLTCHVTYHVTCDL